MEERLILGGTVQLDSLLSTDAFGWTYTGHMIETGQPYLIKHYQIDDFDNPRVQNEVEIFRKIGSKHVPEIAFDAFEEPDGFFLVLQPQFVDNTVRLIIANYAQLNGIEATNVMCDIGELRESLHAIGFTLPSWRTEAMMYCGNGTNHTIWFDFTACEPLVDDEARAKQREGLGVAEVMQEMLPWLQLKERIPDALVNKIDMKLIQLWRQLVADAEVRVNLRRCNSLSEQSVKLQMWEVGLDPSDDDTK